MPTIVMKEAPDVDFYIGWSSIVEAPVWSGTRDQALEILRRESDPYLRDDAPHHPERRLERADKTGTSSLWIESAGLRAKFPEDGSWEDAKGHIYKQRGMCSRANTFALVRRLLADPAADVTDLLTPLHGESEVLL